MRRGISKRSKSQPRVSAKAIAQAQEQAKAKAQTGAQAQTQAGPSTQASLPLSQQEKVDPSGWQQKYQRWSQVGTALTKTWPDNMGLEPHEYRFAEKHGIKLGTKLGSGGQGCVWSATVTDLATGQSAEKAVKVLYIFNYSNNKKRRLDEAVGSMMREADNACGLEHPNLVTPRTVFNIHDEKTQFPYYRVLFVMDRCDGDLEKLIEANNGTLDEQSTRTVMSQVSQGLKFLHENRVAHLDIKPSNILYVGQPDQRRYKLSDFGLSYKFAPQETIRTVVGTPAYRAPELNGLQDAEPKKADIYALGMSMLFMLVGKGKFVQFGQDLRQPSPKMTINAFAYRHRISVEVCHLAQSMARHQFKERPDIDAVIADNWFSIDIKQMPSGP